MRSVDGRRRSAAHRTHTSDFFSLSSLFSHCICSAYNALLELRERKRGTEWTTEGKKSLLPVPERKQEYVCWVPHARLWALVICGVCVRTQCPFIEQDSIFCFFIYVLLNFKEARQRALFTSNAGCIHFVVALLWSPAALVCNVNTAFGIRCVLRMCKWLLPLLCAYVWL